LPARIDYAFDYAPVSFALLLLIHYSRTNLHRPRLQSTITTCETRLNRIENTLAVHLGSLDDSESIAESDFIAGLESPVEHNFDDDDDCDDNWDNSNRCLDEHESKLNCIADYNMETLKDFIYKDEGKIYVEGHAIYLIQLIGRNGLI
jgi:hypothetical protein